MSFQGNSIWYVDHEGGTLTVIAGDSREAHTLATDYLGHNDIRHPLASTDWPPEHWREVAFDNPFDCYHTIHSLQAAGVDSSRVEHRWSVVARDVDWSRLPARVLAKGSEVPDEPATDRADGAGDLPTARRKVDRLTWLRCQAANAHQLAQCYAEEARSYEMAASALAAERGNEDRWSVEGRGLPDDWLSIAGIGQEDVSDD